MSFIRFIFIKLFFFSQFFYSLVKSHSNEFQDVGRIIAKEYQFYCNRKCYNPTTKTYDENVACTYFPCLPSYSCGMIHKRLPFTESDRQLILHLHNSYRNFIASGGDSRLGNFQASDMSVMSYDKELEFLASCWANQCKESPIPALGRDKCRATKLSSYNGQNHWAHASEDVTIDWSNKQFIERAAMDWYDQINNISSEIIDHYITENSQSSEYFSQIIWSSTYLIGCGRTLFSADRFIGLSIVCNYSPGGNMPNNSIFSKGRPCTKYKGMRRNKIYTSLCGEIRPNEEDKYEAPFTLGSTKSQGFIILVLIQSVFNIILSM